MNSYQKLKLKINMDEDYKANKIHLIIRRCIHKIDIWWFELTGGLRKN